MKIRPTTEFMMLIKAIDMAGYSVRSYIENITVMSSLLSVRCRPARNSTQSSIYIDCRSGYSRNNTHQQQN